MGGVAGAADIGREAGAASPVAAAGDDAISGDQIIITDSKEKYGEMILAMKNMYQSGNEKGASSSMESEHGSSESEPNRNSDGDNAAAASEDAAVAPVSEDDVDSVMEKECQEREGGEGAAIDIGMTYAEAVQANKSSDASSTLLQQQQGIPAPKTIFRKGNMGHVIIICQALVDACNSTTIASETAGDPGCDNDTDLIEQAAESPLKAPIAMDEITTTSSFDSLARTDEVLRSRRRRRHRLRSLQH